MNPVAVTTMSAGSVLPDFKQDAVLDKAVDLVGDDGGLAVLDALEEIGVGHKGDALPPRPVARREMRGDIVVRAEHGADLADQLLLDLLGLGDAAAREGVLLVDDLTPHDLVDPFLVDLQPPQLLDDFDGIAAEAEEGRRALQHGDMRAFVRDVRDQRRRGRARADHDDLLAVRSRDHPARSADARCGP